MLNVESIYRCSIDLTAEQVEFFDDWTLEMFPFAWDTFLEKFNQLSESFDFGPYKNFEFDTSCRKTAKKIHRMIQRDLKILQKNFELQKILYALLDNEDQIYTKFPDPKYKLPITSLKKSLQGVDNRKDLIVSLELMLSLSQYVSDENTCNCEDKDDDDVCVHMQAQKQIQTFVR